MKIVINCIVLLTVLTVSAQTGKTVSLKWKLPVTGIVSYNVVMQVIDTSKVTDYQLNPAELSKLFGDSTNYKLAETRKFFSSLSASFQNTDFGMKMKENKYGIIDIEMAAKDKEAHPENKTDTENIITAFPKMMKKLEGNVVLRGAIQHDGSIQSFYLKNEQRNLLAIFFELPAVNVKIGDTWPLAVNLISMDQHFICDTAFKKNVCTLVDLKHVGRETIAVIRYNLAEYISGDFYNPAAGAAKKSTLYMTYNGLAEFSVDKGQWASYEGIMTLRSTGITASITRQKIALLAD